MLHPSESRAARRRTLGGLLALVLAFGAALLPALPAHSATGGATVYALVNEARFANGQAGLLRNGALDDVAAAWANQLAAAGTLSHNPSYSTQIPGGWVRAGENVAQGQPSEAAMHNAWMNSSGHRANILGDYTDIGIAYLAAGGTTWGVEVFASYPGHVGPAAPAAAPAPAPPDAGAPVSAEQGRTSADPADSAGPADAAGSAEEATAGSEPTPSATATPASPSGADRSGSHGTPDAADALDTEAAGAVTAGLWIGIPSMVALAAVAGALLLLRRRGTFGRRAARHSPD